MRLLLDTHIFVWYAKERENLSSNVIALLEDYDNQLYVTSETLKELVTLWRTKPHIRRWWKDPIYMIRSVEDIYHVQILYLHKEHYECCARLILNEEQSHNDPSDHLIIATALCNGMPLISADTKFPFYRSQGLELIGND